MRKHITVDPAAIPALLDFLKDTDTNKLRWDKINLSGDHIMGNIEIPVAGHGWLETEDEDLIEKIEFLPQCSYLEALSKSIAVIAGIHNS